MNKLQKGIVKQKKRYVEKRKVKKLPQPRKERERERNRPTS